MDLVLVSMTGISLVLAIAMGAIVFKLQRDERQRSDARAALLAAAVGDDPELPLIDRSLADASIDDDTPAVAAAGLFAAADQPSPWPQRVGMAAAVALVVGGIGFGLARMGSSAGGAQSTATAPPLELVALQHTLEGDTLIISGTVHNPAAGGVATHLGVAVQVFGADESVVASGKAPLDYATLAPGDDSGFMIKVRVQDTVRRYRVGFRRSDGSVVAHVDRRTGGSSARNTGRTENAPWVR